GKGRPLQRDPRGGRPAGAPRAGDGHRGGGGEGAPADGPRSGGGGPAGGADDHSLSRGVSAPGDDAAGLGTERIEAFSDGVFAIAITLLILEVKVPHAGDPGFSLARALLRLWPQYLAYVLSFVMIGIYWANHHYVFKLYARTDHVFNL